MVRLRISDGDDGPVIRLEASVLETLAAKVGDVLILDRSGWRTQPTTDETERQIKLGFETMHEYRETLAALAKT